MKIELKVSITSIHLQNCLHSHIITIQFVDRVSLTLSLPFVFSVRTYYTYSICIIKIFFTLYCI